MFAPFLRLCYFLNESKLVITILGLPGRRPQDQSIRHASFTASNFLTIHLISITASARIQGDGGGGAVIGRAWEDALTIDSSNPASHNHLNMQEESQ